MANRGSYLLCLLRLPEILALGIEDMPCNSQVGYYDCMLQGRIVPDKLSAKQYKAILNGGSIPALPAPRAMPLLNVDVPMAIEGDDDSDEILDDVGHDIVSPLGLVPAAIADAPAVIADAVSKSSGSSEPNSESSGSEVLDGPDPVPAASMQFLESVGGQRLLFEDSYAKHGYYRFSFKCNSHPRCSRRRNAGIAQKSHLGFFEPLAFLAVWQAMGEELDRTDHMSRHLEVPLDRQRQWLESHGYQVGA